MDNDNMELTVVQLNGCVFFFLPFGIRHHHRLFHEVHSRRTQTKKIFRCILIVVYHRVNFRFSFPFQ